VDGRLSLLPRAMGQPESSKAVFDKCQASYRSGANVQTAKESHMLVAVGLSTSKTWRLRALREGRCSYRRVASNVFAGNFAAFLNV